MIRSPGRSRVGDLEEHPRQKEQHAERLQGCKPHGEVGGIVEAAGRTSLT